VAYFTVGKISHKKYGAILEANINSRSCLPKVLIKAKHNRWTVATANSVLNFKGNEALAVRKYFLMKFTHVITSTSLFPILVYIISG